MSSPQKKPRKQTTPTVEPEIEQDSDALLHEACETTPRSLRTALRLLN